jgi:hypothetical protein
MSRRRKRRWDPGTFKRTKEHGETFVEAPEPMCDFCLSPDVTWEYPATRMPLVGHPIIDVSEGAWAACDGCYRLVEDKQIGALVERSIKGQEQAETPGYVAMQDIYKLRRQLRDNILRFFDARTGPARPFDPTTP